MSATSNRLITDDTGKRIARALELSNSEIAVLSTKSITSNGTYTAVNDNADGYSEITVNVPQTTIESLSVTENGTYTAPSGKAYSPITVNVSGGGGTVVAFIIASYNAGDTVTCSKGATTLTSDTSGYYVFDIPETGSWTLTDGNTTQTVTVEHGDAVSINLISDLPYSETANIIAFANIDNFDAQLQTWGGLSLDNSGTITQISDYVQSNKNFSYQAQSGETSFTIYMTYQGTSTGLARLCAIYTSETNPGKPCWFQENGKILVYDNGNVTSGLSCTDKHVLALSRNATTNVVKWYIDGALFRASSGYTKTPVYAYINGTGTTYISTLNIYSMGVVLGAESDETVIANHQYLMSKYGVSA